MTNEKEEQHGFLQIQNNLMEAGDEYIVDGETVKINFTAKAIYSYLRGFTHNSLQEYAFPSQEKMADMFSCTERSIRNHIRNLEKIGAIRVEKGKDSKKKNGNKEKQQYVNNRYYVNEFPGVNLAPKGHKWTKPKETESSLKESESQPVLSDYDLLFPEDSGINSEHSLEEGFIVDDSIPF